jgi:hypothetical protein
MGLMAADSWASTPGVCSLGTVCVGWGLGGWGGGGHTDATVFAALLHRVPARSL